MQRNNFQSRAGKSNLSSLKEFIPNELRGYSFIHSFFILFSIIIKQFETKIINIGKIKKRKKQYKFFLSIP